MPVVINLRILKFRFRSVPVFPTTNSVKINAGFFTGNFVTICFSAYTVYNVVTKKINKFSQNGTTQFYNI